MSVALAALYVRILTTAPPVLVEALSVFLLPLLDPRLHFVRVLPVPLRCSFPEAVLAVATQAVGAARSSIEVVERLQFPTFRASLHA
jgi:hypothetical protein